MGFWGMEAFPGGTVREFPVPWVRKNDEPSPGWERCPGVDEPQTPWLPFEDALDSLS